MFNYQVSTGHRGVFEIRKHLCFPLLPLNILKLPDFTSELNSQDALLTQTEWSRKGLWPLSSSLIHDSSLSSCNIWSFQNLTKTTTRDGRSSASK